VGEREEANAWQLDGVIDRVILVGLLATVLLAVGAAFLRAAARRFEPPITPSALAAVAASTTALLIAYRIIQEPGFDERSVVKAGAPLSLVVLAVIALACRSALSEEEAGTAWRELPPDETPDAPETPAAT
jgi:drug/metabolite transporter (DMT)-like permease